MAKYTINHNCGHQEEVELFGKETDRQRKIAWLETLECDKCSAAKDIILVLADGTSLKVNKVETGTERQQEWANSLKFDAIKTIDRTSATMIASGRFLKEKIASIRDIAIEAVNNDLDSRSIIDHLKDNAKSFEKIVIAYQIPVK